MEKRSDPKELMNRIDDLQQQLVENQSALQNAIDFYESILALMPGHVYWLDTNNVYLGCNDLQANDANLVSRQDIVGKTNQELPWRDDALELDAVNIEVMKTGKPRKQFETAQMTQGKGIFLSQKVPLKNKHQQIIGLVGISIDVTELKRVEVELTAAKEKAEAASHAKSAFIANMSHDIRTPLSGIIGMAQLLKEAPAQDIPQYASWLLDSGNQLLHLLNDVLDVVSADNLQPQEHALEFFDLNQLLEELLQLLNPSLKTKELSFKLSLDSTLPACLGTDKLKVHRILLNLLGNAIKFTTEGTISLTVQYTTFNEKPAIRFSITDTGQGIGADHLDKIFDRFYRVTPSYKGLYNGHGVGLHIVKQYCEALNGDLQVTSQEGVGSTFAVTIPIEVKINEPGEKAPPVLANAIESHSNTTSLCPVPDEAQPHVLLVEDNAIALRTLETLAEKQNCCIQSAITGEEAFRLATQHHFDLIITDIGLPGISGIELTQKLRDFERLMSAQPMVIVGLTAHAKEEAEEGCLAAGMQAVFTKPATLKTVKEALQTINPLGINQARTPSRSLSADLPNCESSLFELEQYPLLDEQEGINNLGSKAVLCDLLHLMVDKELPSETANLQACYRQQDWPQIEKLAHKLKSSALYCGTKRLKLACQYLERYQKAGHTHLQEALFQQLLQVMAQTQTTIAQWLANQS